MGHKMRDLTDEERAEIDALNAAVKTAMEARRDWLDVKMHECSNLKVGDEIYDLDTGQCLGVVTELYRYWRDRDEGVRDTSYYCDYQYDTGYGYGNNTSSQIGLSYGTRETALQYAEMRASHLRRASR